MPRGRKKKAEVKADESDQEIVEKDIKKYDGRSCYNCGRHVDNSALVRAKGERNEYKFCGIECYNADKTL